MPRQAIRQAECTKCGDTAFRPTDKTMNRHEEYVKYSVRCMSCGESGRIAISTDGTHATDSITYENASWNESEDEQNS